MAQERSKGWNDLKPTFIKEIQLQSKYDPQPVIVNLFRAFYQSSMRYALIASMVDQTPYATLSVNLEDPDYESKDEVAIKNYSENEGFLQQLIEQGIVSQPLRYVESGFVTIPICKLLIQPNNGLN